MDGDETSKLLERGCYVCPTSDATNCIEWIDLLVQLKCRNHKINNAKGSAKTMVTSLCCDDGWLFRSKIITFSKWMKFDPMLAKWLNKPFRWAAVQFNVLNLPNILLNQVSSRRQWSTWSRSPSPAHDISRRIAPVVNHNRRMTEFVESWFRTIEWNESSRSYDEHHMKTTSPPTGQCVPERMPFTHLNANYRLNAVLCLSFRCGD